MSMTWTQGQDLSQKKRRDEASIEYARHQNNDVGFHSDLVSWQKADVFGWLQVASCRLAALLLCRLHHFSMETGRCCQQLHQCDGMLLLF